MTAIVPLRFALYLDLMILFGVPLHTLTITGVVGSGWRGVASWRGGIAAPALLGAMLSIAAFVVMVAGMADRPIASLDPALVREMAGGSTIGMAFVVRTIALLVAAGASVVPRLSATVRQTTAAVAGGVALASLAWTGHGAMDDGAVGWLHLAADVAHLLAAGIWIGGLLSLLLLVIARRTVGPERASAALHGFARIGTAVVATLLATGSVSLWVLLLRPGVPLLPLSAYERLLLFKLAAFGAMLGLAALNRWVLVPRLTRGRAGITASLLLETGLGVAVLAIVALLGTLAPGGG